MLHRVQTCALAQRLDTVQHLVMADAVGLIALPNRLLSCVCKHAKIAKAECRDKCELVH